MRDKGMISKAEHDAAMAEEVHVFPVEDVFHEFAPYFVEHVRQWAQDRFGLLVFHDQRLADAHA